MNSIRTLRRKLAHFLLLTRRDGLREAIRYACERYVPWARNRYTRDMVTFERRYISAWSFSQYPKISVVVPVYNPNMEYLRSCVESIRSQTYPNVELSICDDGSNGEVRNYLLSLDSHALKLCFNDRNLGISGATNRAIQQSAGDFIALVDNDDKLPRYALEEVAKRIASEQPDFVYTDEDKLFPDGTLGQKFAKPGYSPELLLSCNYVGHLSVVRRGLGDEIGWLRSEYDGSQDYDFVLRVFERTERICHVPLVCYHWRISETSVASGSGAKPYAYERAVRALNDALKRRGVEAAVEPVKGMSGHYRLSVAKDVSPVIAIVDARVTRISLQTIQWVRSLCDQGLLKRAFYLSDRGVYSILPCASQLEDVRAWVDDNLLALYVRINGQFIGSPDKAIRELAMLCSVNHCVGVVAPTFVCSLHGRIASAGLDRDQFGMLFEHTNSTGLRMILTDYRNPAACRTWVMMVRGSIVNYILDREPTMDLLHSNDLRPGMRIAVNGRVLFIPSVREWSSR
ncbi:MAG: glycosyltransferase [Alicyclobacillus sp.]|nr:glycosyltransferase [Alicyclobacillus sp.]